MESSTSPFSPTVEKPWQTERGGWAVSACDRKLITWATIGAVAIFCGREITWAGTRAPKPGSAAESKYRLDRQSLARNFRVILTVQPLRDKRITITMKGSAVTCQGSRRTAGASTTDKINPE